MSTTPPPAVAVSRLSVRFDESVPVLSIPPHMAFEDLRAWLREQLPEHASTIGGRTARLDLGGRQIKLFDLRRLVHFLREEFGIDITGLYVRSEVVHAFAERELKLKLFAPRPEPESLAEDMATEELDSDVDVEEGELVPEEESVLAGVTLPTDLEPSDLTETPAAAPPRGDRDPRTLTVRRTLRSGAVVRFDGDVLVFGDVNPGAHLIASGNIVVLGALKGMAHAGAAGDESSFILSLDLRPTQLRIGRKIAIAPARSARSDSLQPEMASVLDGQIVLEPYQGRLRAGSGKA